MAAPIPRKLKKGELLFNEGDTSKSMYFVQGGVIRLFKKKGSGMIELGMIHKGEVIGEMGFLDGGPRSASAEAIHDTDLMEITNANLLEQLKGLPPWLMVLLKTVVNRLRTANNKIRQLETASSSYTYGGEGGVSTTYEFLNTYDVMKLGTALMAASARGAEPGPGKSIKISMGKLNRYANQMLGLHASKITEFLDILERVELVKVDSTVPEKAEVFLIDPDQIELLVTFINEDNMKDHAKKSVISAKSVALMGYMLKYAALFPPNAEGISELNLAKIIEVEKAAHDGKEPFRIDDSFNELVKSKICTELQLKDTATMITQVNPRLLQRMYRIQRVLKEIEAINHKKREQTGRHSGGTHHR